MWSFIDLEGKRFNHLTVMRPLPPSYRCRAAWNVKCNCGRITRMTMKRIENGAACGKCPKVVPLFDRAIGPELPKEKLTKYMCNTCKKPLPESRRFNHLECVQHLSLNDDFITHYYTASEDPDEAEDVGA